MTDTSLEEQQRLTTICIACGDSKNAGSTVCWDCFKYRDNPWKYSELEFEQWLEEVKRCNTN